MRWLTAATILEYARVIFNDVQLDLRPIVDYVEFERGHFRRIIAEAPPPSINRLVQL